MSQRIFIIFITLAIIGCYVFYQKFRLVENFNSEIVHIFWTGGFDSTFRLCQALLDDRKIVQPYYMLVKVDNCKTCYGSTRKNKAKELETMDTIIRLLKQAHPIRSKNLRKLRIINHIPENPSITNAFYKLRLHNYNRKYNQYEAMCRYAVGHNIMMEIGSVGIFGDGGGNLPRDRWGVYLKNNLVNNKGHFSVSNTRSPIHNLRFPIAFLSKKDMLNIAVKNGYDTIIRLTWTCWYPKNGKACNKCIMCRERIIPHVLQK